MPILASFKLMPQSLEKLASFLPKEKFIYLESQFSMQKTASQTDSLKRKRVYPYTYMDTFDKFCEEKLTAKEFWENTREGGEVTISDRDLEQANSAFEEFDCKTLGDYHDLFSHRYFVSSVRLWRVSQSLLCHLRFGLYISIRHPICLVKPLSKSVTLKMNF